MIFDRGITLFKINFYQKKERNSMNKKNLKASSLLLAALMLVSTTGCGGAKKQETTATTKAAAGATTAATKAAAKIEKPTKIVAMLDIFDVTDETIKQKFLAKYKELTGIELVINQPPHNQYYEKVNLAFASGDLPDVVELAPSDNSAFVTYATQGALQDITSLVESSEPMKTANKKLVDGMKIDGKLYGFPSDLGNGTATFVRQDWLTKTGVKAPTNYQEYLTMLKAFTFNDPDGNGKADTKGFTGAGLDNVTDNYRYFLDFMQDAVPGFQYKNGKWVDGFQEPEMTKALERMSSAYKEGVIDKDIVTNKTSTAREKVINGEAGTISYWAGQWNFNLQRDASKINPNVKIVTLPAISEVTYINRVPAAHCITSAAKNPEGVFKYFLEYAHDGADGQNFFTYGAEGLTYQIKDGKGEMLPTPADPSKKFSKTILNPGIPSVPFKKDKDIFTMDPLITESAKIFEAKMVQATIPALTETYIKMNADIIQARSTTFSKIMLGEMTIEQGLAAYKTKVNGELQMEKILTEMNATKK
jgi:putative aldouronate transport system substrate-binding protein